MPINVFGNSSNISENESDTSLFERKPHIRTNYIESNIEEDIDFKNRNGIKNLKDPFRIRDVCSKIYVDSIFKSIIDFKDVNEKKQNLIKSFINQLLVNVWHLKYLLMML